MEKVKGGQVKGVYSSKKNPMDMPAMTKERFGPGSNPDQKKANELLQKQLKKNESLRGVGVY